MNYKPFAYPPDVKVASVHSEATCPGYVDESRPQCPCCQRKPKQPYGNWLSRNIGNDFGGHGQAFVKYFELLKFYSIAILLVISVFSVYMLVKTYEHCNIEKETKDSKCIKAFGLWVVSFQDLVKMERASKGQELGDSLTTLYVLRSVVFLMMLLLNGYLLYKIQVDAEKTVNSSVQSYSLLFHNIDVTWKEHDMKEEIGRECPGVQINEIFFLSRTDLYKYYFDIRNTVYFKMLAEKNQKKKAKLLREVENYHSKMEIYSRRLSQPTGKAVIVLNKIGQKEAVQNRYRGNLCYRILKNLGISTKKSMYAQAISHPDQIYWNYIGESTNKKVGMIILQYITIIVTLLLSYLLLSKGLKLSDKASVSHDVQLQQEIFVFVVAIGVVFLGILFRKLMTKIAQWRKPNTRTAKSLFILSTSIIFHILYYAIIPTIYFTYYTDQRMALKLLSIGVQVVFFILIQFILSALDVFYCFWRRRTHRLLNGAPEGICQKQLHELVEYPGFPLELKLMLLFKSWTFVIFYAFELPYIIGIVLLLFVYLFISDKKNIYTHYKKERVGSKVQATFLKIYSNFYTVFLCFMYLWSQHASYEVAGAVIVSFAAIVWQIFYKPKRNITEDERAVNELEERASYRTEYEKYLRDITSEELETEIGLCLKGDTQAESDKSTSEYLLKRRQDSLLISDSVVDISENLYKKA